MPEQDPIKQRPAWLLAWQDYPHGPLGQTQARELNKYCIMLEAALRKAEQERDNFQRQAKDFDKELERHATDRVNQRAEVAKLKQERDEARRDCADLLEAAKAKLADCLECQDAALMEGEYCSNECGALAIAIDAAMSAHKAAPDVLE